MTLVVRASRDLIRRDFEPAENERFSLTLESLCGISGERERVSQFHIKLRLFPFVFTVHLVCGALPLRSCTLSHTR